MRKVMEKWIRMQINMDLDMTSVAMRTLHFRKMTIPSLRESSLL